MPKYVDHDERRREIIGRVWRLIASDGIEAATTRRIAEVTGYSNGLLRYYFPSKDSVMSAAFEHVFNATNDRASGLVEAPGLEGLRALAIEILPLDEERLAEARVVITFWQRSLGDASEAQLFADRTSQWRISFAHALESAAERGEVREEIDVTEVVDELLSMLMGAQIMAVFAPDEATPSRLLAQLDGFLARVRATRIDH
ncbi:TetR/AcrR family transcriptional regulator [Microbacterium koreense]|uniref:TetR/AcrR family transcriptional regulator n=1 Tax=Microbacterium koreense TaxID=323761 RepID=A0ABW2ZU83_9MICO